jgi:hypothetical protein
MILRATLITLMLAVLGFAFTPSASATCIDSNATDDDGVGTEGCNLPVVSFLNTCKVLAYGEVGPSCAPIQCVREPCP